MSTFHSCRNCENLEARIRELEAELTELKSLMRDYIQNDIGPRVKKAREILEESLRTQLPATSAFVLEQDMREALAALEGK